MSANRNLFILTMALLSSLAPFSTDTYLPAMTAMAEYFSTDAARIQLTLTSFFIAYSFGQLLYGPLSERFGRLKPLYGGTLLFVVSSLLCAFASSVEELIVWRFFQALGASAGVVISKAIITDRFDTKESVPIYSAILIVMGVAPMVAPLAGGYINQSFGWKAIFYFLFALGAIATVLLFKQRETGKESKTVQYIRPYLLLARERNFMSYSLVGGVSMGGMFAYITESPFIFVQHFGFTENQFAWVFALNALAFIVGSKLNIALIRYTTPQALIRYALWGQAAISCGLLAYLFLVADSAVSLMVGLFLFMGSMGFTIANSTSLALEKLSVNASYAGALMGAMQFLIAAVASFAVGRIGLDGSLNLLVLMAVFSFAGAILSVLRRSITSSA